MRRKQMMKLDNILSDFIKSQGWQYGLERVELFDCWDKIVGERAANSTTNKFFRDGILYCTISSSMVRSQLSFQIETIRKGINEEFNKDLVKKIVLK